MPKYKLLMLILSHLCLRLPRGPLPSGFPPKSCLHSSSLPYRATNPARIILLDFIILTIFVEVYKLWSSPSCHFLQSPTISSLFDRNILLSQCSLNIRDQVSHPYRTTSQFFFFCVFRQQTRRRKILGWMVTSLSEINVLLIS
jgi:hypothetical protein